MSRIASLSFNVLMAFVAIAAIAAPNALPDSETNSVERQLPRLEHDELAETGDAEIFYGTFSNSHPGKTQAVSFVWSYDDNGTQKEVWALFRPGTTEGWIFPGPDDTSVDVTFDYEGSIAHTDIEDFLDWCKDQYPSSMNVNKTLDFEVHIHTVDIYQ